MFVCFHIIFKKKIHFFISNSAFLLNLLGVLLLYFKYIVEPREIC